MSVARACATRFGHSSVSTRNPAAGRKWPEKSAHREWQIVGQPRLRDSVAEQRAPGLPSGRSHVRQENLRARIGALQLFDQRQGGARFADGDGVHPQQRSIDRGAGVAAEALPDSEPVPRLFFPAPPQTQGQER